MYRWKYCCMGCLKFYSICFPLGLVVSQLIYKSFIHFQLILVYGISLWSSFLFCMYYSMSPSTIYQRGYFYSILCFCPLCQILTDHRDMCFFLGSLFCSIDLCVCCYNSTRMFWLQWPCSIIWYQVLWSLLLCSSFSKLLRLFRVIYCSIYIFEIFVLYLWNMSWVL